MRRVYPRYPAARLREALADMPVVLVHGPRQSGKTGVVLYDGEASASFGEGLYAVPIRVLWETL